ALSGADFGSSTTCAGTVAIKFFPCEMLSCTSGPLPSHDSLYSPGDSCLPATLTGSLTRTDPLFAANAPVANNRAKDSTNHFEIVETFMPLLVFFPESRRETVPAGRLSHPQEELCVCSQKA